MSHNCKILSLYFLIRLPAVLQPIKKAVKVINCWALPLANSSSQGCWRLSLDYVAP